MEQNYKKYLILQYDKGFEFNNSKPLNFYI